MCAGPEATNPEKAGIEAAEKATEDIINKAALRAKEEAEREAKKAVEEALKIEPLPPSANKSRNMSRHLEEMNFRKVVRIAMAESMKESIEFWRVTG